MVDRRSRCRIDRFGFPLAAKYLEGILSEGPAIQPILVLYGGVN
jgi:hypothetical protein